MWKAEHRRQILTLILVISAACSSPCNRRQLSDGGIVCVCNAAYCDFRPPIVVPLVRGQFDQYTTSRDGLRLEHSRKNFVSDTSEAVTMELNPSVRYQTIKGFGGALTDAAGINIQSLSRKAQENIMRSYFSEEGSNYNFARVGVAGTDYSTRPYTYDDVNGDTDLAHFSLTEEDITIKIPIMKEALRMNPELRFIAASWTAPPWMKTDHRIRKGYLKEEYYQLYADYLIKFLNAYKNHGLEMWAISTGNEPNDNFFNPHINDMGWLPSTVAKWLSENFGPTLRSSEHNKTLILAYDDQRLWLLEYITEMFKNKIAENYSDGIAIHWYTDSVAPPSGLDETHKAYPGKFLIYTEATDGYRGSVKNTVHLGSWNDAEKYVTNIIQDLNHWVTGWVDWNLALNQTGGPFWVDSSSSNAPIIVNPDDDEFYKQPTFYALAHFSKFVPPGSVRIQITINEDTYIKSVAFKTPNDGIAIILYNKGNNTENVIVHDLDRGNINLQIAGKSLHTIVYK